ncbi:MAG TPA: J domain-containing protein [archaeon]|nr:J domain-containing protein [archaeon]
MNRPKGKSVFEQLDQARKTLQLPERASIKKIKEKYRELSKIWHPDLCKKDPEACRQMQQRLNEAYAILIDYCSSFEYSFRKEDVEAHPTGEDFWWEHFGNI